MPVLLLGLEKEAQGLAEREVAEMVGQGQVQVLDPESARARTNPECPIVPLLRRAGRRRCSPHEQPILMSPM